MTQPLAWRSWCRTDVGCVREANEDACLARPERGIWAVADGMGGYAAGDVASAMIVEALAGIPADIPLSEAVEAVELRLLEANRALRELASAKAMQTIGSTVVALVARGRHAVCLWAGDSRLYRLRAGELERVSQDHALVEELVSRGVLTRAQADRHPQSNLVTRAVGAMDELFVDLEIVELRRGDVFVLASDGLDKEAGDDEIAATLADHLGGDPAEALVELALSRGSRDNVTVVTVEVLDAAGAARPGEGVGGEEDTVPGLGTRRDVPPAEGPRDP